jgi:hypothetical protein
MSTDWITGVDCRVDIGGLAFQRHHGDVLAFLGVGMERRTARFCQSKIGSPAPAAFDAGSRFHAAGSYRSRPDHPNASRVHAPMPIPDGTGTDLEIREQQSILVTCCPEKPLFIGVFRSFEAGASYLVPLHIQELGSKMVAGRSRRFDWRPHLSSSG